jgi:Peptidase family M28
VGTAPPDLGLRPPASSTLQACCARAGFDVSTLTYQAPDDDQDAPGARNVIAQIRTGDPAHVVMIGAHLDSVPEGPGIVDDGSGVASLLEIATRLGVGPPVHDTVRFAFFGNEETGSQGSSGYLRGLSVEDRKKIAMYLNVDMVASPNAGYFVQGGEGSDQKSAGPPGSAVIGRELADQLARTGVKAVLVRFVGDDEAPFIKQASPSAAPRSAMPRRRRPSRPRTGAARQANATTAATTNPATASATSTGTRSTTTSGGRGHARALRDLRRRTALRRQGDLVPLPGSASWGRAATRVRAPRSPATGGEQDHGAVNVAALVSVVLGAVLGHPARGPG